MLSDNGSPQLISGECLYFLETKDKQRQAAKQANGYEQTRNAESVPLLSFSTGQMDKLHSRLKQEGIAVGEITKEAGKRSFVFVDPDGNNFSMCEVE